MSVYATAGDIQASLATPAARQRVLEQLAPLHVSRLFLEGRRGDEYVPPSLLTEIRDFFTARGITCSGGIATVPGDNFGVRQNGGLGWLNWEAARTQSDVRGFFVENAPVFSELIVDDFYCTADTSEPSERARGGRPWSQYRRELLVSLIPPLIVEPTRRAVPTARLVLKFPQWYDRFHLYGYDPAQMPRHFDQIWVGTEVRDPRTRRMGYVQPTQGYVNFRWLTAVAGRKVRGAWFDHIECSPQNFVDQAYQSVLAGARELTLFHLGDVVAGHPGDALLATKLSDLRELAARVQSRKPRGLAFYKPPGSDADENLYLADYLAMIGLPILPVAQYPLGANVVVLPVQAAADPSLLRQMRRHLDRGALLVLTPALVRALGEPAKDLAGVDLGPTAPSSALDVQLGGLTIPLNQPLQLDASLRATASTVRIGTGVGGASVPWLTRRQAGRGQVVVLNVRTFSEADFRETGEWLLAPKELGLPEIPPTLADALRAELLPRIEVRFDAPAGVGLYLFGRARCLYNFRDTAVRTTLDGQTVDLAPNGWAWVAGR